MKYIVSDQKGQRIALCDDKKEMRKVGRHYVRTNGAVMVHYASDDGVIMGYSSADTAAVNK